MPSQNVADKIISTLADAKVKRIYGLIGDSLNPLGNAVRKNPKIEWIGVRHEETGALAAASEAFLTNDLCVCAGTAGPGSIHLINGLYEANRNQVPVLALVTDFDSSEVGLDFFQATTPMRLYQDCSLFCERLSSVQQMPRLLQEAMQVAISNKGVAVLIIPKDISAAEIETSPYERIVATTQETIIPNMDEVAQMAKIINKFKNITLYCGIGCKKALPEVLSLANDLKAPIIGTLRSKDFLEANNPYYVGINGLLPSGESKYSLDNCDLLILLGTDFPYPQAIPTKPTIIQVDIVAKHLGRRSRLDFGLVGDIKATIDKLIPLLLHNNNSTHLEKSLQFSRNITDKRRDDAKNMSKNSTLRPEYLTYTLSEVASENAVVSIDVGLNDLWAARYLENKSHRDFIGSFKHGTMAAAIPEAIGAYYANPSRQIIVMAGDGGLTMLMGELLTIVQHKIPLKIIVYNNRELGFIKLEAKFEKIPPFTIELENPDFAKLAEVIGIKSTRVDNPQNLENIIKEALAYPGAYLIDAVTDNDAIGFTF